MSAVPDPSTFTAHASPAIEPAGLTRLEWKVVALALREADNGAGPPAPQASAWRIALRRLARAMTGWQGPTPLADPRLEALRRFVHFARQGHKDLQAQAKNLIAHGFEPQQLQAVTAFAQR